MDTIKRDEEPVRYRDVEWLTLQKKAREAKLKVYEEMTAGLSEPWRLRRTEDREDRTRDG
jgi:hypothetical protein